MQRIVVAVAVMAFLGIGVFFGVGMAGLRIFPCEQQVAADGSIVWSKYSRKKAVGTKMTECRLGMRSAQYTGGAYGMMAGMFLVGPLLLGLFLGSRAAKKDPKPGQATLSMAILALMGAVYCFVQIGMRGGGADMEIILGIVIGSTFFAMLSALISRGGQKLALGGPILCVALMVLSMM